MKKIMKILDFYGDHMHIIHIVAVIIICQFAFEFTQERLMYVCVGYMTGAIAMMLDKINRKEP